MRKTIFFVIAFAVVTMAASVAQAPVGNQVVRIGGVAAEDSEFAFSDNTVTAYSDGNIRNIQGDGDRWKIDAITGKSISYTVKTQSMKVVSGTTPLLHAHEFQFCDQFDQVSRPVDAALRAVLPKDAKVKEEEDYGDGRTLVVYTVPGEDHYWIELSVIDSTKGGGYSLVGKAPATEDGFYCGVQAMTREIRAVLVDEPAGSSNYSAVYFFVIRPRQASRK